MTTLLRTPGCDQRPTVVVEIHRDVRTIDAQVFVCESCYRELARRMPPRVLWDSEHDQTLIEISGCGDVHQARG